MPTNDPRSVLLHRLDHQVDRLTAAGEPDADIATLWELAGALADSLAAWRPIIERLARPPRPAFDPHRAGSLLVECVFDELLEPAACQVLATALDLAVSPR